MAQHIKTDSMNLSEDRSSHTYHEYGSTISMGNYLCNGDSAITLGGNSQYDSIVFYLDVTPNTDEIVVSWNYSWFNAGINKDEFTKIVIEDIFEDTLYSPGPIPFTNKFAIQSTAISLKILVFNYLMF